MVRYRLSWRTSQASTKQIDLIFSRGQPNPVWNHKSSPIGANHHLPWWPRLHHLGARRGRTERRHHMCQESRWSHPALRSADSRITPPARRSSDPGLAKQMQDLAIFKPVVATEYIRDHQRGEDRGRSRLPAAAQRVR
jgi:hypothetical protein